MSIDIMELRHEICSRHQRKRTESKYKNNKDNMVVFYKIWKKYNEIELTKAK